MAACFPHLEDRGQRQHGQEEDPEHGGLALGRATLAHQSLRAGAGAGCEKRSPRALFGARSSTSGRLPKLEACAAHHLLGDDDRGRHGPLQTRGGGRVRSAPRRAATQYRVMGRSAVLTRAIRDSATAHQRRRAFGALGGGRHLCRELRHERGKLLQAGSAELGRGVQTESGTRDTHGCATA